MGLCSFWGRGYNGVLILGEGLKGVGWHGPGIRGGGGIVTAKAVNGVWWSWGGGQLGWGFNGLGVWSWDGNVFVLG